MVVPREERINRSTDQPDWLWMTWSAVLCIVPMDMYCRLRFRTVDIDEEHGLSRIQLCAYLVQNDSSWMTGRSPRQLHKSGFAISARFQLSSRSVYHAFPLPLHPSSHLHHNQNGRLRARESAAMAAASAVLDGVYHRDGLDLVFYGMCHDS